MTKLLRTTLATAFAAACLAGASVAFAADNNGGKNDHNMTDSKSLTNDKDSDVLATDPSSTGSVTCDNNSANQQSGCKDNTKQQ